ncbi:hypothetical protein MA04_02560 [Alcanivorax balearicus MACL04]|uniref:Uncharacterized protein n=1 Tax=Alloalcanivorax balearicus MACL04 TaxID=1177182 RepID=A0ABT2R0F3_9GAMM|nr:hypothetical protein [Alloalcanivorax balearicus]MCU5783260.1 hypothetical protein [Alloalcanivorax balearicus MACL04]
MYAMNVRKALLMILGAAFLGVSVTAAADDGNRPAQMPPDDQRTMPAQPGPPADPDRPGQPAYGNPNGLEGDSRDMGRPDERGWPSGEDRDGGDDTRSDDPDRP